MFALEQLEPFFVKGKSAAIRAHMVGDVVGRFGVARAHRSSAEMSSSGDWEGALDSARDWHGRHVEVVGEPGLGKSRLIEELRANAGSVTTSRPRRSSTNSTAYGAVQRRSGRCSVSTALTARLRATA